MSLLPRFASFFFAFTVSQVVLPVSEATAAIDPDAEVVFLKTDCAGGDDCFETTGALVSWIVNTRVPDASDPLLVKIGSGTFDGIDCLNTPFGHVTFQGSGRELTRISGATSGVAAGSCPALEFADMTIEGAIYSVFWIQGGSSIWTDTDLVGFWYDWGCGNPGNALERGVHYFFGSRITGDTTTAFFSQCGENWLYGSEIAFIPQTAPGSGVHSAVSVGARGDVRLFGSTVRMSTAQLPSTAATGTLEGVLVGNTSNGVFGIVGGNGAFHMHGGIISIDASNLDTADVRGLRVNTTSGGNASAHTPGTAFALRKGSTGTATRVEGPAQSPFLWPAGTAPPTASGEANELVSETGQDLFVETDCKSDGTCDDATPGTESHLMVYDASCTSDPWRDVNTGRCRNETP